MKQVTEMTMNKQQEQIIKDALNIGIESRTRDMDETYPDENQEINHDLKTIDKAWDILFPKEDKDV
jgi:hypothetical protein